MVEKEGTDEGEAMKAYKAVRDESDQDPDVAERNEVSSALIDRVSISIFLSKHLLIFPILAHYGWYILKHPKIYLFMSYFILQVDAMLQNLEKEIDDVDAKIGDRWRLLDRFVIIYVLVFWDAKVLYPRVWFVYESWFI